MTRQILTLAALLALAGAADAATAAKTYRDSKLGFSVTYPTDWRLNKAALPQTGPGTRLLVGFGVPDRLTKGTNLSRDSRISIETLTKGACSAASFLEDGADTKSIRDHGVRYSVGNFADAGAGNFYEQTIHVRVDSKPCLAIRLFIHSTNIGNYTTGTVREFDRKALDAAFDNIRHSLRIGR